MGTGTYVEDIVGKVIAVIERFFEGVREVAKGNALYAVEHQAFGQHFGQHALVHGEFRQAEFQLVHVAVIAYQLRPRHALEPRGQVPLYLRGHIAVPPVPAEHDVVDDPVNALKDEPQQKDITEHPTENHIYKPDGHPDPDENDKKNHALTTVEKCI